MSAQTTDPDITVAGQRGGMVINGVRCDTTTAERVLTDPGGGPVQDDCQRYRFDEVIYRSPEGWWFVVRPLDPEEAWQWIERVDAVEARLRFPDGPTG